MMVAGRTSAFKSGCYKINTSYSVPWRAALCRRARNGHTDVSIMQQMVVACHIVCGMIMQ